MSDTPLLTYAADAAAVELAPETTVEEPAVAAAPARVNCARARYTGIKEGIKAVTLQNSRVGIDLDANRYIAVDERKLPSAESVGIGEVLIRSASITEREAKTPRGVIRIHRIERLLPDDDAAYLDVDVKLPKGVVPVFPVAPTVQALEGNPKRLEKGKRSVWRLNAGDTIRVVYGDGQERIFGWLEGELRSIVFISREQFLEQREPERLAGIRAKKMADAETLLAQDEPHARRAGWYQLIRALADTKAPEEVWTEVAERLCAADDLSTSENDVFKALCPHAAIAGTVEQELVVRKKQTLRQRGMDVIAKMVGDPVEIPTRTRNGKARKAARFFTGAPEPTAA